MATSRRKFAGLLATVGLLVSGIAMTAPAATAAGTGPDVTFQSGHGINVASGAWQAVAPNGSLTPDPYLIDVTMTTPDIFTASGGVPTQGEDPINVRIYLPHTYQPAPHAPYPVLYLLNGGWGTYSDWSSQGDLENQIATSGSNFNGIVVMPDGGRAGWYTNWAGRTDGNFSPQWEDYLVNELVPWIDQNLNTVSNKSGRAIAGLSMGGLGALNLAVRHPDVYSAIGAFSPGIDLTGGAATVSEGGWGMGATYDTTGLTDGKFRVNKYLPDGVTLDLDQTDQLHYRMDTIFGPSTPAYVYRYDQSNPPPTSTVYNWPTYNPLDEAANPSGDPFAAYSGKFGLYAGGCQGVNTTASPCVPDAPQNPFSPSPETGIGGPAFALQNTLAATNVSDRYCTGNGEHTWTYWKRDFRDFLQYVYGASSGTIESCPDA